jgi:hypothetical protein
MSIDDIAMLTAEKFSTDRNGRAASKRGMTWLLDLLAEHSGMSWQQRWEAAGLNGPGHSIAGLTGGDAKRRKLVTTAAGHAFGMRLIQPSLVAFRATSPPCYVPKFRLAAGDPLLGEFCARLEKHPVSTDRRKLAMSDVCRALTVFGIDLVDLTPEALVHYADQNRGSASATAWPVLFDMGRFPTWMPRTLQDSRIRGQQPIEEPVDRHHLRNGEVRDLLVDYIRRRSVEVDTPRWRTSSAAWSSTSGRSSKTSIRTRPTCA